MYNIKRSERKSLGLYALKDGGFEVRAPYFVTDEEISEFVQKNKNITEQWQLNAEMKRNMRLNYGSSIPFRGKQYELVPRKGNQCGFNGECFFAPPELESDELIRIITNLLKKLAKQSILPLAKSIAEKTNSKACRFGVTSAKTRWGSCSVKGSINFSWRLTCASEECIEYVVIHELCHLVFPDHSKRFWSEVEKYIPDWRKRREALGDTQKILDALGLF